MGALAPAARTGPRFFLCGLLALRLNHNGAAMPAAL